MREQLDLAKMQFLQLAIVDNCYDCDCGDGGCDDGGCDCVSCDNCDCDSSKD